ncbi:hypothetical protein AB0K15_32560 [Amycolatopsis sp. NPDC049253]
MPASEDARLGMVWQFGVYGAAGGLLVELLALFGAVTAWQAALRT